MRDEPPVSHQRLEDSLGARDDEGRQAGGEDREIPEEQDGDDRHHDLDQGPAERARHSALAAGRAAGPRPPGSRQEPPDVGRCLHESRIAPELGPTRAGRRHRDQLEDATRGRGEDQHAVRQEHRLVDVMRDEQDRLGPPDELLTEPLAELLSLHLVEGRERLVHQQHGRIVGQRARDVDSLEHAAREMVRPLLLVPSEPELPQELAGGEARASRDPLREHDVVDGALPGKDRGSLGHEPEQALRAGGAGRLGPIRTSPLDGDSRSATIRRSVVLPQPDGPTRATNSPAPTSRSILSSASVSPKRRETPRIEIGSTDQAPLARPRCQPARPDAPPFLCSARRPVSA